MKKVSVRIVHHYNEKPEFELVNAYNISKVEGICIAKFPDSSLPYSVCDIATGCGAGRRFKTLTECRDYLETTFLLYKMKELETIRKNSEHYKKLVRDKQEFGRSEEESL